MKFFLLSLILLASQPMVANAVPYIEKYDTQEAIQFLIACESGGDKYALNNDEPHGSSYGILQFRLETFQEQGKKYGLPHDDIYSEKQQIDIATKMIDDNLGFRWSCYKDYLEYLN